MTPGEYRLRVCYAKAGRLRWLSHLEVVRALERAVRRSGLPYAVTAGFNPHMKAAFGPALPVGTAGDMEYLDVWLTRYTEPVRALASLAASSAPDLTPLQAVYVDDKSPALTAVLTIAKYRLDVKGEGLASTVVRGALQGTIATGRIDIEHKGKTKVFDLARTVPEDPRVEDVTGGVEVYLTIRMGPQGSLRPSSLVQASLGGATAEAATVHTTRLDLLIEDEDGSWSRPV